MTQTELAQKVGGYDIECSGPIAPNKPGTLTLSFGNPIVADT